MDRGARRREDDGGLGAKGRVGPGAAGDGGAEAAAGELAALTLATGGGGGEPGADGRSGDRRPDGAGRAGGDGAEGAAGGGRDDAGGAGDEAGRGESPAASVWDPRSPYACAYCGICEQASVARCVTTGRWFCNGRVQGRRSCIVAHLVASSCRAVALHPSSPLGEAALECYATGARNVFALGWAPLAGQSAVALLARDVPADHPAIAGLGLDIAAWSPLVEDRALASWLVPPPCHEAMRMAARRPPRALRALEDSWRRGEVDATADSAQAALAAGEGADPEPVALRYRSPEDYVRVYSALVDLEAAESREAVHARSRPDVSVRWLARADDGGPVRVALPQPRDAAEGRVAPGDEIRLSIGAPDGEPGASAPRGDAAGAAPAPGALGGGRASWSADGVVAFVDDASEEIVVELKRAGDPSSPSPSAKEGGGGGARRGAARDGPPTHLSAGFRLDFVWHETPYKRQKAAIAELARRAGPRSGAPLRILLGGEPPDAGEAAAGEMTAAARLAAAPRPPERPDARPGAAAERDPSAPGLPRVNGSQAEAIRAVLGSTLTLIQGPPGTGKTLTSATAVYRMVRAGGGRVLVAAPSNTAVDALARRIALTGLRVARLQPRSREGVAGEAEALTLRRQAVALARETDPALAERLGLDAASNPAGSAHLARVAPRRLARELLPFEERVLAAADVVCCTCIGAADPRLASARFARVLIDEAAQAVEPEALVPLARGAEQVVLVGDHCQLGPVVLSARATRLGLGLSLFERLVLLGVRPRRLAVQYRMHPALAAWPSLAFYEGTLRNGVSAREREPARAALPWPSPAVPAAFWAVPGAEELSPSGTSYLNRAEAEAVARAVGELLRAGARPGSIGVVTPYSGQRARIVAELRRAPDVAAAVARAAGGEGAAAHPGGVEVASVDAFQGREKDYIIFSCVRASERGGLGFVNDPRRLNVAITRARLGLLLVGSPHALARDRLWAALLRAYDEAAAVVEGPLHNLQRYRRPLPPAPADAPAGATPAIARFAPVAWGGDLPALPGRARRAARAEG